MGAGQQSQSLSESIPGRDARPKLAYVLHGTSLKPSIDTPNYPHQFCLQNNITRTISTASGSVRRATFNHRAPHVTPESTQSPSPPPPPGICSIENGRVPARKIVFVEPCGNFSLGRLGGRTRPALEYAQVSDLPTQGTVFFEELGTGRSCTEMRCKSDVPGRYLK